MAKNENNSHAFIRKMVENIKQTKDGQCPDDPKINEVFLVSRMLCFFMWLFKSCFNRENPRNVDNFQNWTLKENSGANEPLV